jgi:hypothetical protein
MMKFLVCPDCGANNLPDADVCQVCGAVLAPGAPAPEHPAEDKARLAEEKSEDLPGIFSALRTDADSSSDERLDSEGDVEKTPDNADGLFPDDEESEAEIPDWLNRVRQRASEEDDAVGDLVMRLSAQEENHDQDRQEDRHESFDVWIQRLREQARDKAAGLPEEDALMEDVDDDQAEDDPTWLNRLRKNHNDLPAVDGEFVQPSDAQDDDEHLPDWLVNLSDRPQKKDVLQDSKPSGSGSEAALDSQSSDTEDTEETDSVKTPEEHQDVEGDAGESTPPEEETRQIFPRPVSLRAESTKPVAVQKETLYFGGEFEPLPEKDEAHLENEPSVFSDVLLESLGLDVTRQQRQQADLLAGIVANELNVRTPRKRKTHTGGWVLRLLVGILLILGLGLSLFAGGPALLPEDLLQPSGEAFIAGLTELPPSADVLLIFNYQPGYSGEMALIAEPVLAALIRADHYLYRVFSSASSPLIAEDLLTAVLMKQGLTEEDVQINDVGYYPVSGYGAFGLGSQLLSRQNHVPESFSTMASFPDDVDAVFLMVDHYAGARLWIEQLSALQPDLPVYVIGTAQTGPMLTPFWESGQVAGVLSGVSAAAGFESEVSQENEVARRWRAYQTGVVMMMALLVLGLVFGIGVSNEESRRGGA